MNWPVFQGLTLQFVIRLRFLLKLLTNLEVGHNSWFGLHTCRCQLLETLNPPQKNCRTVFVPPYFAQYQPLSTQAASVQDPEHCSPPQQRAQRCERAAGEVRTTTTNVRLGCQCHQGFHWLQHPSGFYAGYFICTVKLKYHKVEFPSLIIDNLFERKCYRYSSSWWSRYQGAALLS